MLLITGMIAASENWVNMPDKNYSQYTAQKSHHPPGNHHASHL